MATPHRLARTQRILPLVRAPYEARLARRLVCWDIEQLPQAPLRRFLRRFLVAMAARLRGPQAAYAFATGSRTAITLNAGTRRTEPLERELTYGFHFDVFLDLRVETLSVPGPGRPLPRRRAAMPGWSPSHCCVGAALEPDLAARRVAERDTGPQAPALTGLAPRRRQRRHLLSERTRNVAEPRAGASGNSRGGR